MTHWYLGLLGIELYREGTIYVATIRDILNLEKHVNRAEKMKYIWR